MLDKIETVSSFLHREMNSRILFYLALVNSVICNDYIELSCAADKFSITISDDSIFPTPNSSGNNKVKIGKCEFDLTTIPETVEEWISHITVHKNNAVF